LTALIRFVVLGFCTVLIADLEDLVYLLEQVPTEKLPQAVTTAHRVPNCTTVSTGGAVELLINAVTGVAGFVLVGVSNHFSFVHRYRNHIQ
jgi:hypothetical protein